MKWSRFVEKIYDWSEDTIRKRVTELEDFGSSQEIVEAANDIYDEDINKVLLQKAMDAGIKFTPSDIYKLEGAVDVETAELLVKTAMDRGDVFPYYLIKEIKWMVSEEFLNEIVEDSIRKGVSFTADQIYDFNWLVEENILNEAFLKSKAAFTQKDLLRLEGSVDYDLLQEKDKELGTQAFPEEEEYDDSWEEESENYDEENWDEEFDDDTDDDWDEEIDENSNTAVHQEQRPIAATSPKKYIYLLVSFSPGGKTYAYRTEDGMIDVNDIVLVPVSGESDKLAVVVKVLVCTEKDAPYPVSKTKMITGRTDIRKKDWIKAVNRKQSRKPVHSKPVKYKPKDDLDWIDRLEMLDAIFDDD